jgi:hypothetical protein
MRSPAGHSSAGHVSWEFVFYYLPPLIICCVSESTPASNLPTASDDATLIDWLREREIPCPMCGYNLRALQTPRCPECGQMLRLSVTLAEPYLKAWVTLLVFSCLGSSVGLLFLIAVLKSGLPPGAIPRLGACILMASTPLPPIVLLTRRGFLKLSRAAQWRWAGPVAGLIALGYGCFLTLVR